MDILTAADRVVTAPSRRLRTCLPICVVALGVILTPVWVGLLLWGAYTILVQLIG